MAADLHLIEEEAVRRADGELAREGEHASLPLPPERQLLQLGLNDPQPGLELRAFQHAIVVLVQDLGTHTGPRPPGSALDLLCNASFPCNWQTHGIATQKYARRVEI